MQLVTAISPIKVLIFALILVRSNDRNLHLRSLARSDLGPPPPEVRHVLRMSRPKCLLLSEPKYGNSGARRASFEFHRLVSTRYIHGSTTTDLVIAWLTEVLASCRTRTWSQMQLPDLELPTAVHRIVHLVLLRPTGQNE